MDIASVEGVRFLIDARVIAMPRQTNPSRADNAVQRDCTGWAATGALEVKDAPAWLSVLIRWDPARNFPVVSR